ncbi:alpha/beta hydrolase [Rhizobium sp. P32RR-XVIII]|uniref:alpha/beta hydrolase n=1 Tax=Rhizobium sp. P32RR-XVIII TaxID=2726738 RepID=UPI0014579072|nr:alpha/beta hydrolase [Rhizobium sp. P32RR-XVIII]NLS07279.1 alpha/beta hydrolase [Rhizobium sp. P32RR-XVIII]
MTLKTLLDRNGRNAIPFTFDRQPGRGIILHTYKSAGYAPGKDVVFVQHGMLRNGDEYRDFWIPAADRHDLLIVAPTFPDADFKGAENYNDGMVRDAGGLVTPPSSWIYHVPALVAAALVEAGVITEGRVRIFGHSAGSQFLHRMVSLVGFGPFKAVAAANAGWYSLPTLDKPFPAGLAETGLAEVDLKRLLETPLHVMAGLKDCEATADHLPSQPEAIAQGPGRLQRARNYFAKAKAAAERLDCGFNWQFTEVPDVAHDGRAMSVAAAGIWFEGRLPDPAQLGARPNAVVA